MRRSLLELLVHPKQPCTDEMYVYTCMYVHIIIIIIIINEHTSTGAEETYTK